MEFTKVTSHIALPCCASYSQNGIRWSPLLFLHFVIFKDFTRLAILSEQCWWLLSIITQCRLGSIIMNVSAIRIGLLIIDVHRSINLHSVWANAPWIVHRFRSSLDSLWLLIGSTVSPRSTHVTHSKLIFIVRLHLWSVTSSCIVGFS